MTRRIEICRDAEAVTKQASEFVAERAQAAVRDHGRFTFAVSGGHTPWAMFKALSSKDMPWHDVTIFQVDERVAPDGDPDRNLTHLRASLPRGVGTDIHAMPVEEPDLERAAAEYARSLPQAFDLVHLGLGPDGHTASLVPGDPVLDVIDRDVAVTGVYNGRRRMTLTYALLERAPSVLWLVTGADKASMLPRLCAGDRSIPAGRVSAANATLIADEAAASQLAGGAREADLGS
jgi:6-phosphogluconolactonase